MLKYREFSLEPNDLKDSAKSFNALQPCVKYRSRKATSYWHSFISGKLNSNAAVYTFINFSNYESIDGDLQGWLVILLYPEGLVQTSRQGVMQSREVAQQF